LRRTLARLAVAAAALAEAAPAFAGLSVNPAYVTTRLDQGNVTAAITVTNLDGVVAHFRANAHHFIYSLDGSVEPVAPDAHSLAPWVKLNPREFALGPHASRVVRVAVVPPPRLAPGEYWAAIEFDPLEATVKETADKAGHAVRIQVISSIYIPIIGTVGKATHAWRFDALHAYREKDGGVEVDGIVANSGTGRLRVLGHCALFDSSGAVVARRDIGETVLLPGSERRFRREFTAKDLTDASRPGALARMICLSDILSDSLVAESPIAEAPPAASSPTPDPGPAPEPHAVPKTSSPAGSAGS